MVAVPRPRRSCTRGSAEEWQQRQLPELPSSVPPHARETGDCTPGRSRTGPSYSYRKRCTSPSERRKGPKGMLVPCRADPQTQAQTVSSKSESDARCHNASEEVNVWLSWLWHGVAGVANVWQRVVSTLWSCRVCCLPFDVCFLLLKLKFLSCHPSYERCDCCVVFTQIRTRVERVTASCSTTTSRLPSLLCG